MTVHGDYTASSGTIGVESGGMLDGKGTVSKATEVRIAGILNINGLTFTDGLDFENLAKINLGGGLTVDAVTVEGEVGAEAGDVLSFGANLTINLWGTEANWIFDASGILDDSKENGLVVFTYTDMDLADTFNLGSVNLIFEGAPLDLDDLSWISALVDDGEGNIYIPFLTYTPIPEPSTWLLLGAGAAFVAIFRRRKNS